MKVEQDLDYCTVCGRVVKEGSEHSDEKHLSGEFAAKAEAKQSGRIW